MFLEILKSLARSRIRTYDTQICSEASSHCAMLLDDSFE